MQSRLAIVLMSVAGTAALFGIGFVLGLGVMSTPKPEQHKEIALTTTPTKVTRAETTGSGTRDDRALTPLTPVAPGGAAAQAATPTPAQSDQASAKPTPQAAAPQPAPAPQPQQQTAAAAPVEVAPQQASEPKAAPTPAPAQTAKAEPAPAAQPASNATHATPVSLSSRNACDVSACSRAYRSFRESDCTYQPFSGPRQVCVSPPGAKDASRDHDARQVSRSDDDEPTARVRVHRAGRGDELSSVVREVERMTDGRRSGDDERPLARGYHRDFTADGEDDRIVPADVDRGGFDDEDDQ
jgi:hypothetical protein